MSRHNTPRLNPTRDIDTDTIDATINKSDDIETEEELVKRALRIETQLKGKKLYRDLEYVASEESGPRANFRATYGSPNSDGHKRRLKIDRNDIESKRAQLHYDNGCDTENDFDTLTDLGPDTYRHHVSPVLDVWQVVDRKGRKRTITAEKEFEGYISLNSLLPELKYKPLTKKEFATLSEHVLDALGYIDEKNKYHRDFSLRNIITNFRTKNKDGNELEAIVVDLANSCKKSHPKAKPQATMGAKQIADPLMLPQITGKLKAYDDKAEVYSVAKDFLEMLIGEKLIEIDQLRGTAIVTDNQFTGEFDLFENEKFRSDQYALLINTAISNLPRHAKKYASVLRRALSLDEKQRYSSTREFIRDWHKHDNKDFAGTIKKIGLWTLTGITLATGGYTLDSIFNKQTPMDIYKVHAAWNVDTKEVDNNLFDVKMMVSSKSSATQIDPQYIFAKQGEEMYAYVSMFYRALDKKYEPGTIYFRGRAYVEGLGTDTASNTNIERFFINPVPPGSWSDMGDLGNTKYIFHKLKIPKDALPGSVYNMVVELYAMDDTAKVRSWNSEKQDYENESTAIIFDNSDKAVYTKRIPILIPNDFEVTIGDRKETAGVLMCNGLDQVGYYTPTVSFNAVSETDNYAYGDRDVKVLARIPEMGYLKKFSSEDGSGASNSRHYQLELPSGDSLKGLTLQVISYKNGKILNQSFFPVERLDRKENFVFHDYVECLPDTSYSNKVVKYSREAKNLIR